ncbi:OFA family MFS transporter, partial [Nitrospirota bacterium]
SFLTPHSVSSFATPSGTRVIIAATGINLALGVLYTWSIFKGAIRESIETGTGGFDWDLASLNDPYAVCCLVFAFAMILAGKCQDVIGPRKTAAIGGILVGLGFVWVSQTSDYLSWILGFGVIGGTGIAFGYSSATPAALKWYPPSMTGKISGIVVSGFGLASVYIAPLAIYLLSLWGLKGAMLFFGIAFFIVVSFLSLMLIPPPEGYKPEGVDERRKENNDDDRSKTLEDLDISPVEMLKSPIFWMLWILYFIGAGAGLMVIGSIAGMAKASMGSNAFLAVAILAIGNAGGRLAAGILSDRIGRKKTLSAVFTFQAVLMFISAFIIGSGSNNTLLLVLLSTFIGFNYGANLSLFPSFAKDLWGMRNFGVNYGIIFTAWGVGGFMMSRVSQSLFAESGTFTGSFIVAGVLLSIGVLTSFFIKDLKDEMRREIRMELATDKDITEG